MVVTAALMLVSNAKEFFEDPAFLIGIPLVALGVIGALIVFSPIGIDRRSQADTETAAEARAESSRGEEQP